MLAATQSPRPMAVLRRRRTGWRRATDFTRWLRARHAFRLVEPATALVVATFGAGGAVPAPPAVTIYLVPIVLNRDGVVVRREMRSGTFRRMELGAGIRPERARAAPPARTLLRRSRQSSTARPGGFQGLRAIRGLLVIQRRPIRPPLADGRRRHAERPVPSSLAQRPPAPRPESLLGATRPALPRGAGRLRSGASAAPSGQAGPDRIISADPFRPTSRQTEALLSGNRVNPNGEPADRGRPAATPTVVRPDAVTILPGSAFRSVEPTARHAQGISESEQEAGVGRTLPLRVPAGPARTAERSIGGSAHAETAPARVDAVPASTDHRPGSFPPERRPTKPIRAAIATIARHPTSRRALPASAGYANRGLLRSTRRPAPASRGSIGILTLQAGMDEAATSGAPSSAMPSPHHRSSAMPPPRPAPALRDPASTAAAPRRALAIIPQRAGTDGPPPLAAPTLHHRAPATPAMPTGGRVAVAAPTAPVPTPPPPELDAAALRRALARASDSEIGPFADRLFRHFQRQVRQLQERRGGL